MYHTFSTANETGERREWLQTYSEWRPTRYSVKDSNGRRYGLFTSHEKASRFADGVLLSLDDDEAHVSIRPVHTNFFVWRGDDIGCSSGNAAIVHVHDEFGSLLSWSVREVLRRAPLVDAHGIRRIVLALRVCSNIHPDDLAAWREVEDEFPVIEVASIDKGTLL